MPRKRKRHAIRSQPLLFLIFLGIVVAAFFAGYIMRVEANGGPLQTLNIHSGHEAGDLAITKPSGAAESLRDILTNLEVDCSSSGEVLVGFDNNLRPVCGSGIGGTG